nr:hypothetical protein [Halomonas sp. BC04]
MRRDPTVFVIGEDIVGGMGHLGTRTPGVAFSGLPRGSPPNSDAIVSWIRQSARWPISGRQQVPLLPVRDRSPS